VIYFGYGRTHSVLAASLAAEISKHGVSHAGSLAADPGPPTPRR